MCGKLLSGPNPPELPVLTATLGATLAKHRVNPQVYIGCMKSGPVLAHKGVRYHETEHWKFREEGNKYFRYATGQLYAILKDLATYISINQNMLHKYVNEDVSLGSWFIGLDVEYIDDRKLCCGTPPCNVPCGLSSGTSHIDGRTLSLGQRFCNDACDGQHRFTGRAEAKAERGLIPGSDQEREGRLQPYAIRSSRRKKQQQQLVEWYQRRKTKASSNF
ncbi:probable beta-1,3-galactosyltransferase 2 isoform X1 [Tanacetum coccineum]|uniref:Hexosyltransferase n=1 Tax=Tanacetum coccineum TaxID=301880 RepID=A0ABQ5BY81_9ASTR